MIDFFDVNAVRSLCLCGVSIIGKVPAMLVPFPCRLDFPFRRAAQWLYYTAPHSLQVSQSAKTENTRMDLQWFSSAVVVLCGQSDRLTLEGGSVMYEMPPRKIWNKQACKKSEGHIKNHFQVTIITTQTYWKERFPFNFRFLWLNVNDRSGFGSIICLPALEMWLRSV